MKMRYGVCFGMLFLLCLAAVPVQAQQSYKQLQFPPLNDFQIPSVEQAVLENGLTLYLLEDHELPTISLFGMVRFNVGDELAAKTGLIPLTTAVMRTGGTKTRSGDEIDIELDRLAASVGVSGGTSSGGFYASSLVDQWDRTLAILADILKNPAFPEDKIELKKIEARSMISRRNDEPFPIVVREFIKLVYGPDSPYARHTEYATIDAITREDLIAFHRTHFHPERMMVAVIGDFKAAEMKKKLTEAFRELPRGDVAPTKVPEVREFPAAKVNLIAKEDVNQSVILIGHLGGLMNNPDYFALEVMNNVLGGGFGSRLFKRVRSEQGLAYSVFGTYGSGYDHEGICYFGCSTKSGNTIKGIRALLREIEEIRRSEITDEELNTAKEMYLNSFVFNFDSRAKIIDRLVELEYFGYPKDFLEITKKNIEKVTKADILRVAQKYLQPDKMRIVVLGKPADFDGKLEEFGAVQKIDITIPGSPKAVPAK
ncbi:MAG TPA: pitrilysin family protein [Candidatus Ozemobacteraceae bacterium]|nr:pitrilysin family protein [Candidatus Ozemobacteraceae bacterium]